MSSSFEKALEEMWLGGLKADDLSLSVGGLAKGKRRIVIKKRKSKQLTLGSNLGPIYKKKQGRVAA